MSHLQTIFEKEINDTHPEILSSDGQWVADEDVVGYIKSLFLNYSNAGRIILEGHLDAIVAEWKPSRRIKVAAHRNLELDTNSALIRMKHPEKSIGTGADIEFLKPYRASIRAGIKSLLLIKYTTHNERCVSHFLCWFAPHYRRELFEILEQIIRTESAALELDLLMEKIPFVELASGLSEPEKREKYRLMFDFESYTKRALRSSVLEFKSLMKSIPRRIHEKDAKPGKCVFCMDDFRKADSVNKLPCGHEFHKGCLGKWVRKSKTCPTCRQGFCRRTL